MSYCPKVGANLCKLEIGRLVRRFVPYPDKFAYVYMAKKTVSLTALIGVSQCLFNVFYGVFTGIRLKS